MMEVIQKAQELGAAIADSSILEKLNSSEDAMHNNPDSRLLMSSYQAKQKALADLQSRDSSREAISAAVEELRAMTGQLHANPIIETYINAQQEFNTMMQQVNSILRFCITGEVEDECDCGSCSGCGGECDDEGCDCGHDHSH